MQRLAALVADRGAALGMAPEQVEKARQAFADAGLAVAVISAPKQSDKVPQIEQVYSAGAVCLALVNAALASGWGANWLSGWAAYDPVITEQGLGLAPGESVAGFVHMGTETAPPPERPRPDVNALTTWVGA